jgi:hypothetical protein
MMKLPPARFLLNVLFKGLALFAAANLLFAALNPAGLGNLSLYNAVFPGRERLPFGENPQASYNLSLYDLNAMFASHEVSAARQSSANAYRVFLIGDSSVWGTLQRPEETLAGQLNALGLTACDGRPLTFYNLGYPTISLSKDLLILQQAMNYHPDALVWLTTLEAFPKEKQLASPILANNPAAGRQLITRYGLKLDTNDPAWVNSNFWQRTIIGQRRSLADLLRLQLYGLMWSATGIDQEYPTDYARAQVDLPADRSFDSRQGPDLAVDSLQMDALAAGQKIADGKPLLLVNEPIMISEGKNSDLRYDFYYPRWAYDQYRDLLQTSAGQSGMKSLDLWDIVPPDQFTNSAIHLTPAGEQLLAQSLSGAVVNLFCSTAAQATPLAPAQPEATAAVAQTIPNNQTLTPASTVVANMPQTTPASSKSSLTPTTTPAPAWQSLPVIPALSARAKAIYQQGQQMGANPHAFSKIGDCESSPSWFLGDFDRGARYYDLGQYSDLQAVIDQFSGSWGRISLSAKSGFNAASVLTALWADHSVCNKGETPLACELRLWKPSFAILTLGTNDTVHPERFEPQMRKVLDELIAAGVVPVLATKADNLEKSGSINASLTSLAKEYDLPLWNFWAAVQPLDHHGLQPDGAHLSWGSNRFGDPAELTRAWPVRNLTALQVMDALWRQAAQP